LAAKLSANIRSREKGLLEEVCSAKPNCLRPAQTRPEIFQFDWVQCDNCQLWFHLFCVNLTKIQVEDKDFFCKICKMDVTKKGKYFVHLLAKGQLISE
jgi:hypothetical protein